MQTIASLIVLSVCVVALAAGCSKQPSAATSDAATNAAAAARPSERGPGNKLPPPAPATIADSGNVNATLDQLTTELRKYVINTRSVPKDYDEFAAKSHVNAPPPPPGNKYAIKNQAVVLVKR
jgi:hypothetical protein